MTKALCCIVNPMTMGSLLYDLAETFNLSTDNCVECFAKRLSVYLDSRPSSPIAEATASKPVQ